jgi:hypothetical protein
VRRSLSVTPPQKPDHICAQLVKIALERGSRDNVSALLVLLPKDQPPVQGNALLMRRMDREAVASACTDASVVYAMRSGIDLACAHIRVQRIRQRERDAAAQRAAAAIIKAANAPNRKCLIERKSSFDASIDTLKRLPVNLVSQQPTLDEVDEDTTPVPEDDPTPPPSPDAAPEPTTAVVADSTRAASLAADANGSDAEHVTSADDAVGETDTHAQVIGESEEVPAVTADPAAAADGGDGNSITESTLV